MIMTDGNEVEYNLEGVTRAATREEPAESPDVVIISVIDMDGKEVKLTDTLQDKYEEEIWEHIGEQDEANRNPW